MRPGRRRVDTAERMGRSPESVANKREITVAVATQEEIKEKVVKIVSEQMGVDKNDINMETSFVNDLNADSLDTVELVMEFEDEFEISIPDEEAEKIQTVGHAVEYIAKNQKKE